ncbi:cytochrome c and c1 heme-lyase [Hypoxylon sp. FL1284]|nr:cytochrome c and c1 heme-lyase [Hypoxylon sp. FL1284]
MAQSDQSACPVDHKSREAWLEQARAAGPEGSQSLPPSHPPIPSAQSTTAAADSCPVDHKAREVWLQHAARSASASSQTGAPIASSTAASTTNTTPTTSSSWTSYLPRIPFFSSSSSSSPSTSSTPSQQPPSLGMDREVSTIPRSSPSKSGGEGEDDRRRPANTEVGTGADVTSGNWVYPSERMFFEAMKRKGHDPRATDMRTVVPIHNAVNERAWAEIKAWERPYYVKGSSCDGPRLHSFSGLSTRMSPKARINTLLGYQAPFDRHDWVVDRCGKEVEYIIDFYAGRGSPADGKLSFYLDVRPKLNSWEGVKMRAMRAAGVI